MLKTECNRPFHLFYIGKHTSKIFGGNIFFTFALVPLLKMRLCLRFLLLFIHCSNDHVFLLRSL